MMPPSPDRTAFVLVPGRHMTGASYGKVNDALRKKGFAVEVIEHVSQRTDRQPPASVYDDAASVTASAAAFMDAGKDVVIVGNSYGGFVVTQAAQGLADADRKAANRTGGRLINLVFIGCVVSPLGLTCAEVINTFADVKFESEGDFVPAPPLQAAFAFMSDASEAEALDIGNQMQPQSVISMHGKITYPGHLHVPTTWCVTERDGIVPPAEQHKAVDALIQSQQGNQRKLVMQWDHLAMVGHADEVVQVLLNAAIVS